MTEIRQVSEDDWRVMRDIRLDALREAPDAFGSTYAREAVFTVGTSLVAAMVDWARKRDIGRLNLWVTDTNEAARLLYERCGFTPTGERQPLPSNPARTEIGMTLPL